MTAVVNSSDDQWRAVAVRLVADTEVMERGFDGRNVPSMPMGAYVLEAGRLVITRLERLTARLDEVYGDDLDEPSRARLRAAMSQLRATGRELMGLSDALAPAGPYSRAGERQSG